MTARASRVAAVIPAYNEAATIADVARRTAARVRWVIVVDDGSSDGTAAALADLPVELIENARNLGKSASLMRGFERALALGAERVVTLDGDGQHRPEDIPRLLEAASHAPDDIIIGARLIGRERMPALRRLGNATADFWISWASGYPLRDTQSGLRLYPAVALARIRRRRSNGSGFVLESEILIDAARDGRYASWIAVETIYGEDARGSYYRALGDTLAIVVMVAGKLLRRGLYPLGLLRSLGALPHTRAARTGSRYVIDLD